MSTMQTPVKVAVIFDLDGTVTGVSECVSGSASGSASDSVSKCVSECVSGSAVRRVSWQSDVIDNEHLNKRKTDDEYWDGR
jgi:hypothetical protein